MSVISELKEIAKTIEAQKEYLNQMLELKRNPLDPEVVVVSKMLDILLNQYNELVNGKDDIKIEIKISAITNK